MHELNVAAYAPQVNMELLDNIVSFVSEAAKANYTQREELRRRCVFPLSLNGLAADEMQHRYSFLYLGELLERYEKRFGMTIPDRRAIALALGYTRDLVTPEMFVGNQKVNFIQETQKFAKNDLYLTGALYMIQEGESSATATEQRLKEWNYTQTEELVFALSLFSDMEHVFPLLSGRLVSLLGKERTIPIWGNTDILNHAIAMLYPLKKQMKGRQMNLLRALLSLPVSFVKEGDKHYGWLREHGYEPIEIAYANMAALNAQFVPDCPRRQSITAEKIAVSLFRSVLSSDKALPSKVYEWLSELYHLHDHFEVKCYGERRLIDTLYDGLMIQTPETMAWFLKCCNDPAHPAVKSFDIMKPKWDSLVNSLDSQAYEELFEHSLSEAMDTAQIQERLERYQILTGKDYLDRYSENSYVCGFDFMVNKGIIDLWTVFLSCIRDDGTVSNTNLLKHIGRYCRGIPTIHAFEFLKKFLPVYGYRGKTEFFDDYRRGFENELWEISYRSQVDLKLDRAFLSDDPEARLVLLHWVDEAIYMSCPEMYPKFLLAVLESEEISSLLAPEDLRGMFDLVIIQPGLPVYTAKRLKQRYLTPEEQREDQAEQIAAEEKKKNQTHLELVEKVEAEYNQFVDGTFSSVEKYLNHYRFFNAMETVSCHVVRKNLEQLLQNYGYVLTTEEAVNFLDICRILLRVCAIKWAEVQTYIMKIKEAVENDPC